MKSLALCSNDFYNNSPEWLSSYETPSYISDIYNFTSYINTLINNDNNNLNNINNTNDNLMVMDRVQPTANIITPSNNFLLYYYVEYM